MSLRDDLIDKRIVDRNLRRGVVEMKSYRSYVEALPDVSDKAEPLQPPGGPASAANDSTEQESS